MTTATTSHRELLCDVDFCIAECIMVNNERLLADDVASVWWDGGSRYLLHTAAGDFVYNELTRRLRRWPGTPEQWRLVNAGTVSMGVIRVGEICGANCKN